MSFKINLGEYTKFLKSSILSEYANLIIGLIWIYFLELTEGIIDNCGMNLSKIKLKNQQRRFF